MGVLNQGIHERVEDDHVRSIQNVEETTCREEGGILVEKQSTQYKTELGSITRL